MKSESAFRFSDYLTSSLDLDFFRESNILLKHRLHEVGLLCHFHCLPSLIYLIEALANVGINPGQIYVLPKPYSTIASAITALLAAKVNVIQAQVDFRPGLYDEAGQSLLESGVQLVARLVSQQSRIRRLVIVDDGGLLTAAWWRLNRTQSARLEVVSVQQTASGFGKRRRGRSPFVKIDVARSAAKRFFEAKIIVEGVLGKVASLDRVMQTTKHFGVVGLGAVGSKLAMMLRDRGKDVWAYDRANLPPIDGLNYTETWRQCLRMSDVVFGCTGTNWLDVDQVLRPVSDSIRFISCSSRDVEFKNLLQHRSASHEDDGPAFGPLRSTLPNGTLCRVANWGFPINFDRQVEWESADDIALTRGLMYGGILQALATDAHALHERVEPLSVTVQHALVENWLDWQGKTSEAYGVSRDAFDDLDWWRRNSAPAEDAAGNEA